MEDNLENNVARVRMQLESDRPITEDDLLAIEGSARQLLGSARPSLFGRVIGFNPIAILQLVLLIIELVRQIRALRRNP